MRIDVLTLFPEMFEGMFSSSIIGKAKDRGLVQLNTVNFREFATSKHHTVDDTPYGGGGGMVLKPEPIFAAVEHLQALAHADHASAACSMESKEQAADSMPKPRVVLLCPQGETFTQKKAESLANESHLILICGHYEGYDERIRQHLVTDEISIGDYVLTGGEVPAMVVIDSIVRLMPGVLGNEHSAVADSFSTGLLEYPHYTRPAQFREWAVPDILLSGHHANVERWRREQALFRTWQRRPDLLSDAALTPAERQLIASWEKDKTDE